MSRKKKGKTQPFARKLKWTTLLALVFSGSVIMGHRFLQSDEKPPLVALSSSRQVSPEVKSESARAEVIKSKFSFYNHLSGGKVLETSIPSALEERVVRAAGMRLKSRPVSEPLDLEVGPADSVQTPETEYVEEPVEKTVTVPVVELAPIVDSPPAVAETVPVAAPLAQENTNLQVASDTPVTRFTLQVSTHTSRAAATRDLERLRAQKLDAQMVTTEVNSDKVYRIRVGKFSSHEELKAYQTQLQSDRGLSSIGVEL